MNISVPFPAPDQAAAPLNGFGGTSPQGDAISVNSRWLSRNGTPWVPVMGEFHFSRFPREDWVASLRKIRAGGVGIVATYLFWLHHEEVEGQFRWDGDRDVGAFVRACAEQGLDVVLRIGPWAHGECRNGGFPDWLGEKPFEIRGNGPEYLSLVRRFYEAIFTEVQGLLFKDGGPVIGIQLENEFGHCGGLHGEEGKRHIRTLKQLALAAGFEVPLFTSTGWGGGIVVDGETLPVLGGYADAPWAQHVEPLPPSDMFVFRPLVAETGIGTDLASEHVAAFTYDVAANPYLTAELGGGLQVTHHRRPIVEAPDVEAMAVVKLGCGANLLGYYMYHGGTNPVGALSTLQESRATGYANDLPEWSYDFQAPLGEYGQVRPSWKSLRLIHLFLKDYGASLATMPFLLPEANTRDAGDETGLRVAIRGGEGGGFLFVNRHQRGKSLSEIPAVAFLVGDPAMGMTSYAYPEATLRSGRCHIWPYGMDLDGVVLTTATAQPLCRLEGPETVTHVFFAHEDTGAALRFADGTVLSVAPGARESIRFEVDAQGGKGMPMLDKPVEVLVLTRTDAENAQKIRIADQEMLLVSEGTLVQEAEDRISLTTGLVDSVLIGYPESVAQRMLSDMILSTEGVVAVPCRVNGRSALRVRFTPAQGEVSVSGSEKIGVRSAALDTRKAVWETNTYPQEEVCHLSVALALSLPEIPGVYDWFLELAPEGDAARLYVDGTIRGDWFYTGNPWDISLKRHLRESGDPHTVLWRNAATHAFRIEVDPLRKTDAVYLEKQPAWYHGEACQIRSMRVKPEYRCELTVR